jgi:Domain of unknown function DUF29
MNKPVHPVAAEPLTYPDYHRDAYGWAMAQAAIIRAGRIDSIDWENVAEEIESVAKQEQRLAEDALRTYLIARIKWDFQPGFRCEALADEIGWLLTEFDSVMRENPGLEPKLDQMLAYAYRGARAEAAIETGFDDRLIPADGPNWPDIRSAPVPGRKS